MSDLFEEIVELPQSRAEERYAELVGLDEFKERVAKEAEVLLLPERLREWSRTHHGDVIPAVKRMSRRPPLVVFAGDVGTGKTTLAETFGDEIARRLSQPLVVYRLSLRVRGSGAVGEMTKLLGDAFAEIISEATRTKGAGHILIIDEADALAESRALSQMHHEDRAGVNALIRGIDQVTESSSPILVVMITNRESALDPAVLRRAAAVLKFERPTLEQRLLVLRSGLTGIGLDEEQLQRLASLTGGEEQGTPYGHSYSDLVDRVIPAAILAAYPDRSVSVDLLETEVRKHPATKPFDVGQ